MNNPIKIIVVGCGNMAKTQERVCMEKKVPCCPIIQAQYDMDIVDGCDRGMPLVAIHYGSGRQLPELLELCGKHRIPLIQASTTLSNPLPEKVPCPVIEAPNLALLILETLGALPAFAQSLTTAEEKSVVEIHQEGKKSLPGTAVKFAEAIGVPKGEIVSVREPALQLELGIPRYALAGHAKHILRFFGGGTEVVVITQVNGRDPYAIGGIFLAQKAAEFRLQLIEAPLVHRAEIFLRSIRGEKSLT